MTTEGLWLEVGQMVYQAAWDTSDVRLRIERGCYANGNTAIRVVIQDTGEVYATLSSNSEERLPDGEFFLKYWSENKELADVFARLHYVELVFVEEPQEGRHPMVVYKLVG